MSRRQWWGIGVAVALVLGLVAGSASAAFITWGAPTAVTWNASDVSTDGTFVDAVTMWADADLTVNGVTFQSRTGYSGDVYSFDTSNITINKSVGGLGVQGPAGSVYEQMVSTAGYFNNNDTGTITLGGLTSGQEYQVQIWAPYWNATDRYAVYDGTVNLYSGNWQTPTPPQYVIGTFTANATSQTVSFRNSSDGAWAETPSAIQLRVIPEPATFGVMISALAAVVIRRRRMG
jgi:hypothetical protein